MSDSRTMARAAVGTRTPRSAAPARHVLIADSDGDSRAVREAELRDAGFDVLVARTGFEAIVKASCHVPDVILLDAALGDLDAGETTRMLTTCPVTAHIPVIQLTPGRGMRQRTISRLRRAAIF